jgi:hypothetical protein
MLVEQLIPTETVEPTRFPLVRLALEIAGALVIGGLVPPSMDCARTTIHSLYRA